MPDPGVADAVVDRLRAWRIPRVFGHPQEAVAAVVEALDATGDDPQFVPVRDAEDAAVMAAGHARFTGEPGVCLAAGGVAAAGLLAGLDAARGAGLPVLAVVTEPVVTEPVVSASEAARVVHRQLAEVCHRLRYVTEPARAPELVDEALRAATRARGPVGLVVPHPAPHGAMLVAASGPGIDVRLVLDELSSRLPPNSVVTADGTGPTAGFANPAGSPAEVVIGPAGLPGSALPYALAAKMAAPDRPVIALVTDDGMRSHGLSELITIARRRPAWPDPRLVVLVHNTRSGHPRCLDPARPVTDDVPYAGWARLLGLHGVRVDRPELVGAAWDEALNADRPCVLEIVTNALTFGSWNRPGFDNIGDSAVPGDGGTATSPMLPDGDGAPAMAGWRSWREGARSAG
ncbi:thiamine pyrophosphate-binding protein [Verrucosispora sp. WMMA2121]|uniref:thiamine pyrophosphate-binding protein n=1 Tax=Verrucosispora sp. WMMA2121 TaxID=3015164 RepID=UPI0022B6E85F|nr:thiamine pyrophosphate-binding protein [Verrucosispora sp. WMMA2121]MCZ7422458.1 thiamine pyrophosphate-binding protein [Verrucosispora sp. WMMA2121]